MAALFRRVFFTVDVTDRIETIVTGHPAVLFMKGTPEFPMCGLSNRAVVALNAARVPFYAVNVLADPEIRAGLPAYANRPGFPQLFIQGELMGGCEIVEELNASGQLARILTDTGGQDGA